LAGARGKFSLGAPIKKNFFPKIFFSGEQLPPPKKIFGQCTIFGVKNFSGRVHGNCFPATLSHFLPASHFSSYLISGIPGYSIDKSFENSIENTF
jgi:hypothetical protein